MFAIEGCPHQTKEDLACTSKPCEWNKPSKRIKEPRSIEDINFKKVKYEDSEKSNSKEKNSNLNTNVSYKVDGISFREKLCNKLGNSSRAALFDILPQIETPLNIEDDLNVGQFEEVETSEHFKFVSDTFIDLPATIASEESYGNMH